MGIGAIAMLAMAGPALTDDRKDPKKDEVFHVTTVYTSTGRICQPAGTFFSFDISWFDPMLNKYFLADRNNKAIDVVDPTNLTASHNSSTRGSRASLATMTSPVPTAW